MYLAGRQRRRSLTLWLRAMLRRGTLQIPRIYLCCTCICILCPSATDQRRSTSSTSSNSSNPPICTFLSICGQSAVALHCPSNLICKGLFVTSGLNCYSFTALPTTHCSSAPSAQLQRPQQRARHSTRPRTGSGSGSGALPNLPPLLLLSIPLPPLFSLFPSFSP
ncbi:hypothetical protein V8C34DRAFT_317596 [Trichoderma compactum]